MAPIQKDYRTEGRRQVERVCGCVSMEKGAPLNGKRGGFGSDGGVMPRTLEVGLDGGACSVHLASRRAWIGSRNEFDSKRLSMTFKMIVNDFQNDSH